MMMTSSRFPAGGACNASLYPRIQVTITIPFINNALSLSILLSLMLVCGSEGRRGREQGEKGGVAFIIRARSLYCCCRQQAAVAPPCTAAAGKQQQQSCSRQR